MPEQIELLMRWYSLDEEAAREVLAELKDKTSLQALTTDRVGTGGAVRKRPPIKVTG